MSIEIFFQVHFGFLCIQRKISNFTIFFQGFRSSRQDAANNDNGPLDIGTIAAAGERCVDKVVMVQETEYDGKFHQNSTKFNIPTLG